MKGNNDVVMIVAGLILGILIVAAWDIKKISHAVEDGCEFNRSKTSLEGK